MSLPDLDHHCHVIATKILFKNLLKGVAVNYQHSFTNMLIKQRYKFFLRMVSPVGWGSLACVSDPYRKEQD